MCRMMKSGRISQLAGNVTAPRLVLPHLHGPLTNLLHPGGQLAKLNTLLFCKFLTDSLGLGICRITKASLPAGIRRESSVKRKEG